MSEPELTLSVILPLYNAAAFVGEAIASLRRQAKAGLQIIVVDDGSTDGGGEIVRGLGDDIIYVRQENAGPAAARNRGLALATGAVIGFVDADDWWPDDKLALQLPCLQADPQLEVVSGHIQYHAEPGYTLPEVELDERQSMAHVHLGAALVRRTVFERLGPFAESLRLSEDMEFFLRVREAEVKTLILPQITLHYRVHGGNMTRGLQAHEFMLTRTLHMSLARRRQSQGQARNVASWNSLRKDPPKP